MMAHYRAARAQLPLKPRLEHAIAEWDRRCNGKNNHAGAIALLRLDECLQDVANGTPLEQALRASFNDRLLIRLLKAAGFDSSLPTTATL